MKQLAVWSAVSAVLMIGCPWLAVTFAGDAGMAICFILFFALNPLFSAVCGFAAGKNLRRLWGLPLINAALFLAGTWIFFELGEPAFLLYGGCYLVIGAVCILLHALVRKRRHGA